MPDLLDQIEVHLRDHQLVLVLAAEGDRVALAINRGAVPGRIDLPESRQGHVWQLLADSSAAERAVTGIDGPIDIPARAILVLAEAEQLAPAAMRKGGSDMLDRLAEAAGIAGTWEGADHSLHTVGDDTKRALLKALNLPAEPFPGPISGPGTDR